MDLKELAKVVEFIAEEKKIDPEKVVEAVEVSLAAAYRKEYGHKGMVVKAKLDLKTGQVKFWQVKIIVDPNEVKIIKEGEEELMPNNDSEEELMPKYNSDKHIFLDEAKKINSEIEVGEEMTWPLETPTGEFGRIAAQTAKQNILQKLREIERESILSEFHGRENTIISGLIRRFERGTVYVDLGRAEGVMFAHESIPGEHYRIGDRMRFYVAAIQDDYRGAGIILSRRHPKFISKLFESEVPELEDGAVEIKAVARLAGQRTKIAVASNDQGVDAVGSFVGQRGTRVMAVNNEVGQEKIDIIEWSENPEEYIANALSPAKVGEVEINEKREVIVFIPEDQLSLAIGKGGQNVHLAAKLTGWKIDVRSQAKPDEQVEGGVAIAEEEIPEEEIINIKESKESGQEEKIIKTKEVNDGIDKKIKK